ncbi:hypothetical protein C7M84_003509 [Penaeus vannamei]|uniref:Uncharacterized protein n=1 Tax=Penaeus vannamei TaxID=6689 RepID=A0A3R7P7P1_PENVA|nr:hypothetical protein C7M84_003509 [Penaeus vannamei]
MCSLSLSSLSLVHLSSSPFSLLPSPLSLSLSPPLFLSLSSYSRRPPLSCSLNAALTLPLALIRQSISPLSPASHRLPKFSQRASPLHHHSSHLFPLPSSLSHSSPVKVVSSHPPRSWSPPLPCLRPRTPHLTTLRRLQSPRHLLRPLPHRPSPGPVPPSIPLTSHPFTLTAGVVEGITPINRPLFSSCSYHPLSPSPSSSPSPLSSSDSRLFSALPSLAPTAKYSSSLSYCALPHSRSPSVFFSSPLSLSSHILRKSSTLSPPHITLPVIIHFFYKILKPCRPRFLPRGFPLLFHFGLPIHPRLCDLVHNAWCPVASLLTRRLYLLSPSPIACPLLPRIIDFISLPSSPSPRPFRSFLSSHSPSYPSPSPSHLLSLSLTSLPLSTPSTLSAPPNPNTAPHHSLPITSLLRAVDLLTSVKTPSHLPSPSDPSLPLLFHHPPSSLSLPPSPSPSSSPSSLPPIIPLPPPSLSLTPPSPLLPPSLSLSSPPSPSLPPSLSLSLPLPPSLPSPSPSLLSPSPSSLSLSLSPRVFPLRSYRQLEIPRPIELYLSAQGIPPIDDSLPEPKEAANPNPLSTQPNGNPTPNRTLSRHVLGEAQGIRANRNSPRRPEKNSRQSNSSHRPKEIPPLVTRTPSRPRNPANRTLSRPRNPAKECRRQSNSLPPKESRQSNSLPPRISRQSKLSPAQESRQSARTLSPPAQGIPPIELSLRPRNPANRTLFPPKESRPNSLTAQGIPPISLPAQGIPVRTLSRPRNPGALFISHRSHGAHASGDKSS